MKKGILSAWLIGSASFLFAQNADPTVMKVGNEQVPLSEFETIFLKNHPKDKPVTKAELDEYSGLFINFKLKVQAAKAAGIDTTAAFRNEFNGYKRQLGQPYLKDKEMEDRLLNEAVERMKTDLHVAHIVIKSKSDCMSPADTAELYKKALDVRKRLLKGESFEKLAAELSEDSYSNKTGGDLGWFTGLMWAYPFETAAYNLKKGELSMPVKTNMGYHIIKLVDSRPARGEVKTAHIFVAPASQSADDKAKARAKIDEAYNQLKAGKPWQEVVNTFSEDKTTSANGGELPAFGINKMVQEFEDAAFALKNEGDFSEPFATKYGLHIVKLVDRVEKKADENREELRKQLQKNVRNKVVTESFAQKVKKELGFTENTALLNKLKALEAASPRRVLRLGQLDSLPDETLFTLGAKIYKLSDLNAYLKMRMPRGGEFNYCNFETKYLLPFEETKATEVAEANLESKYSDYRSLLKEYREGIMIFDMMDKKVWSKSVEDSAGLAAYFNANRNNYMWKDRIAAYRVIGPDSLTLVKVKKEAQKVTAGKMTVTDLAAKFNKKQTVIVVNEELKEPGESAELDALASATDKTGKISKSKENWYFYLFSGMRKPEPKDLKSAKGLVISDYQNYLEQHWLDELKAAYPVTVNKEVMYKLAK